MMLLLLLLVSLLLLFLHITGLVQLLPIKTLYMIKLDGNFVM